MRPSGPVPPAHAPLFRVFKHLDIGRARSARRAGIFLFVSSPCRVAPTGGRFPPLVVFFPGVFPVRRLEPDKGTHQPLFPVALPQYALWYVQTRSHCKLPVAFLVLQILNHVSTGCFHSACDLYCRCPSGCFCGGCSLWSTARTHHGYILRRFSCAVQPVRPVDYGPYTRSVDLYCRWPSGCFCGGCSLLSTTWTHD